MKRILPLLLIVFLVFPTSLSVSPLEAGNRGIVSLRTSCEEVIVIPDSDPYFGFLGANAACWYNVGESSAGLKPLLVHHHGVFSAAQQRFIATYGEQTDATVLALGEQVENVDTTAEILGSPAVVSLQLALHLYTTAAKVLLLPYHSEDADDLTLMMMASPLSCYLDIPVIIYDGNQLEIQQVLAELDTSHAYIIGETSISLPGITQTVLSTEDDIQHLVLSSIYQQFGEMNYITVTNPADTLPPTLQEKNITVFEDHVQSTTVTLFGNTVPIRGNDTVTFMLDIPEQINEVQIFGRIVKDYLNIPGLLFDLDPVLFATLYDSSGNIVAYSNSYASHEGTVLLKTLTCNASGEYRLDIKVYHGLLGGFFSQRGFSRVDADLEVSVKTSTLATPHYPLVSDLSMLAPYLTSVHGGVIVADPAFALTTEDYVIHAQGAGTGPWYNESLQEFNNQQVNNTVGEIEQTLALLDDYDLLDGYLDGPAWLALLGDTNMIPMYYYGPSQQGIPEKGLPSDNLYSLGMNLSVGRIMGWDVQDVSALLCRTLFYGEICGQPVEDDDWFDAFHFIFGEGFGETGGLFHQVPYAREIRQYGFDAKVYGDFRNGRVFAELFDVYTGANYIEYLGHGDWFWFPPSLYGFDTYSKAITVAHVKNWVFEKPSVFLSSACLMGRVDGLPPNQNIGLAMLHAGCNAFVGATRETGQEAGLTTLENHLLVDDMSLGEALRGEKQVDQELPTFYVRTLFGDPAFNPYEPNNGFSDQGLAAFP